jgi:hypothetical protein
VPIHTKRRRQTKKLTRPYTVFKAPVVKAPLEGTDEFIRQVVKRAGGSLWNNGSFQLRDIRTKPGQISNHARGLAVDFSYRKMNDKGIVEGRKTAMPFVQKLLRNADKLGIELVIDYQLNRSWKCDRGTWIKGKWSGGDWFHVEISLAIANNANLVKQAFSDVFKDMPKTV